MLSRPPIGTGLNPPFGGTGFGMQPTIPPMQQPFHGLSRGLPLPPPPPLMPGQQAAPLPPIASMNNTNDLFNRSNHLPPLPPHNQMPPDLMSNARPNNTNNLNGNKRGSNNFGEFFFTLSFCIPFSVPVLCLQPYHFTLARWSLSHSLRNSPSLKPFMHPKYKACYTKSLSKSVIADPSTGMPPNQNLFSAPPMDQSKAMINPSLPSLSTPLPQPQQPPQAKRNPFVPRPPKSSQSLHFSSDLVLI